MTIKDLKNYLQEKLNQLEDMDEGQEVKLVSNTYFLRGAREILETKEGFLDLENPTGEEWY